MFNDHIKKAPTAATTYPFPSLTGMQITFQEDRKPGQSPDPWQDQESSFFKATPKRRIPSTMTSGVE